MPSRVKSYKGVHFYTVVQVVVAIAIFILTLTKGAPGFPLVIIALVPIRLLVMNRVWDREVLRFVDAWACREGSPEDDADRQKESEQQGGEEVFQQHQTAVGV